LEKVLALNDHEFAQFSENFYSRFKTRKQQEAMLKFFDAELASALNENGSNDELDRRFVFARSILTQLARSLARANPEIALQTLADAQLTPASQAQLAANLAQSSQLSAPEKWLPYLAEHTSGPDRSKHLKTAIAQWTGNDFRSTARWIQEQPPGELRDLATYAFADTVAPYEPASAGEWAASLPASAERAELMSYIVKCWQNTDPEAAEDYAGQHGL
jgi:hypothetical protein